VKYTEKGFVSLTVRFRSEVAEVEVSDSGYGIEPEDLERVFQPFERGRAPNVRSVPGTGLGLTITKLLTEIMGGEILVLSMPGKGTTFSVRLLLSEAKPDALQLAPRKRICGYAGKRVSVLLVDDDVSHLDISGRLLRSLGFNVSIAPDAASGLESIGRSRVDLVLLDISMPGMSGWQMARALRALPDQQYLKIIFVSANAHDNVPSSDDTRVHDAFVMKPVDVQTLLDRVGELLGLEWLHEPERIEPALLLPDPRAPAPEPALPEASRHHLDDLYRLGRIGHVRGIHAKLTEMAAEHPQNEAVASQLRALDSNFELKRYMNVLEAMRKNG
jgi:CheY-like chemotaxis protein